MVTHSVAKAICSNKKGYLACEGTDSEEEIEGERRKPSKMQDLTSPTLRCGQRRHQKRSETEARVRQSLLLSNKVSWLQLLTRQATPTYDIEWMEMSKLRSQEVARLYHPSPRYVGRQ